MATTEFVMITEPGLQGFLTAVREKWNEGWEIDEKHPPYVHLYSYVCGMTREVLNEQEQAAKLTRAEILANARAAKAAKAQGATQ